VAASERSALLVRAQVGEPENQGVTSRGVAPLSLYRAPASPVLPASNASIGKSGAALVARGPPPRPARGKVADPPVEVQRVGSMSGPWLMSLLYGTLARVSNRRAEMFCMRYSNAFSVLPNRAASSRSPDAWNTGTGRVPSSHSVISIDCGLQLIV